MADGIDKAASDFGKNAGAAMADEFQQKLKNFPPQFRKLLENVGQDFESAQAEAKKQKPGSAARLQAQEHVEYQRARHKKLAARVRNDRGFSSFLSRSGADLDEQGIEKAHRNYRAQQMLADKRSRGGKNFVDYQMGLVQAGMFNSLVGSVTQHVPVAGDAVHRAVSGYGMARAAGSGVGGALKLGALGAAVGGLSSAIGTAYGGFKEEEQTQRLFAQMVGVRRAKHNLSGIRAEGFTNQETRSLLPLGRATGGFTDANAVAGMGLTYGLGNESIGLLGSMTKTGSKGSQANVLKDAIEAGMVSGLERGRFGEMLDGIRAVIQQQAIGVQVDESAAGQFAALSGGIGRIGGMRGSQLMQTMSLLDSSVRGGGGPLNQAISYMGAFSGVQDRNNAGANWATSPLGSSFVETLRMQEQGLLGRKGQGVGAARKWIQGYAGLSRFTKQDQQMLNRFDKLGGNFAVREFSHAGAKEEVSSAKKRADMMDFYISKSTGSSMEQARVLRSSLMDGSMTDDKLKEWMDAAKPQDEKNADNIRDLLSTARNIEINTDAIKRLAAAGLGGDFANTIEWATSKGNFERLDKFRGTHSRLREAVEKEKDLYGWQKHNRTSTSKEAMKVLNSDPANAQAALTSASAGIQARYKIDRDVMKKLTDRVSSVLKDAAEGKGAYVDFSAAPLDLSTGRAARTDAAKDAFKVILDELLLAARQAADQLQTNSQSLIGGGP